MTLCVAPEELKNQKDFFTGLSLVLNIKQHCRLDLNYLDQNKSSSTFSPYGDTQSHKEEKHEPHGKVGEVCL